MIQIERDVIGGDMKNPQKKTGKMPKKTAKAEESEEIHKSWISRKFDFVIKTIKSLLTQGISPHKIALAFSVGVVTGTFPIMGTHTFIGIFFAFILGLNQVAVYIGVWLSLPVFFLLLLPSLRTGEYVLNAPSMNIDNFMNNLKRMMNSVNDFFDVWNQYGQSILHMIIGWIPYSILVGFIVYFITLFFAKIVANKKK